MLKIVMRGLRALVVSVLLLSVLLITPQAVLADKTFTIPPEQRETIAAPASPGASVDSAVDAAKELTEDAKDAAKEQAKAAKKAAKEAEKKAKAEAKEQKEAAKAEAKKAKEQAKAEAKKAKEAAKAEAKRVKEAAKTAVGADED